MSQEESSPVVPADIPQTIRVTAWILLILMAVVGVASVILSFVVPPDEVLMENPFTGHRYLAESLAVRVAGALLVIILSGLFVLLMVFILKARMWAYYVALVLFVWDMFSKTSSLTPFSMRTVFHIDIVSLILMIIFAVNYRGYRRFTDYQRRRATPQGEPDSA